MNNTNRDFEPYAVAVLKEGRLEFLGHYKDRDELVLGYHALRRLSEGLASIPIAVEIVDLRKNKWSDITSTLKQ